MVPHRAELVILAINRIERGVRGEKQLCVQGDLCDLKLSFANIRFIRGKKMSKLKNKVAIITGAASGIGRAAAQLFAQEGAAVVVADVQEKQGQQVVQDIQAAGGRALFVRTDVTIEADAENLIEKTLSAFAALDIAYNNAGYEHVEDAHTLAAEHWQRQIEINLTGTFLACREALPIMQRQDYGRIICVASLAGQVGGVVAGANYSASKAGVLSLVKSLARQSEKPWITVNAISPGPVDGSMTDAWPDEQRDRVRDSIPLKRFATADEVASLAIFLASPRAAYIHGARIDLNGGLFMG